MYQRKVLCIKFNGLNNHKLKLQKSRRKRGIVFQSLLSLNLLAVLAPFSREMKELSGEPLSRVELEKCLTYNQLY